ncbi:MAG: type II toxin-antitoxin system HipA family toxin [Leptospirales bacterium]
MTVDAQVFLQGSSQKILVGRLQRIGKADRYAFIFDESYLAISPLERPILSLSFLNKNYEPQSPRQITNTKLNPWFSNLLPEGKLREYVAGQHSFHPDRDFPMIIALGKDLPGAVIIEPAEKEEGFGGDNTDIETSSQENSWKFSLAGVQLKFSAIRETKGGLTIPVHGRGGSWIVKLPSDVYEAVPENEYDMMRLAKKAGFPVPEIDLVEMRNIHGLPPGIKQERMAFVIRRFDRRFDGGRIHMEDFAQVFGLYPSEKYGKISYGNIAKTVFAFSGEKGLREFISRLVFNAVIGNGDMHAKNWSILYSDGKTPELSPPYDFVSTIPYVSQEETLGLSIAKTKRFSDFSLSLLKNFAGKTNLPENLIIDSAKETVERTWTVWKELRWDLASPEFIRQAVDEHMQKLPIFQEVLGNKSIQVAPKSIGHQPG